MNEAFKCDQTRAGRPTGPSLRARQAVITALTLQGTKSADQLAAYTGMDRRTIFSTLKFLCAAGVTARVKEGRLVHYYVDEDGVEIDAALRIWRGEMFAQLREQRRVCRRYAPKLVHAVDVLFEKDAENIERFLSEGEDMVGAITSAEHARFVKMNYPVYSPVLGEVEEAGELDARSFDENDNPRHTARPTGRLGSVVELQAVKKIKNEINELKDKSSGDPAFRREFETLVASFGPLLALGPRRQRKALDQTRLAFQDEDTARGFVFMAAAVEAAMDLFGPLALRWLQPPATSVYCDLMTLAIFLTPAKRDAFAGKMRKAKAAIRPHVLAMLSNLSNQLQSLSRASKS